MQPIIINDTINLDRPVTTNWLKGDLFSGEAMAHAFKLTAVRDGEPVALSGTVTGRFVRANYTSILLGGSIVDGKAYVELPQDCYNVPGRFEMVIMVTDSNRTVCTYSIVGNVRRTQIGDLIDSGDIVPDIEEIIDLYDDMRAATSAATEAARHAVQYDAAQTLTDAQQAQARANIDATATGDVEALQELVKTLCPAVTVGPAAVASVSDAVALAPDVLTVAVTPTQAGTGDPAPDNIRPITGWTGANVHHGESADDPDAQTYAFAFPAAAGTVYGGTLDVLTGVLTVTHAAITVDGSTIVFRINPSNTTEYRADSVIFKQQAMNASRAVSNWLPSNVLRINAGTGFVYGKITDYTALGFDSAEAINAKCAETSLVMVYALASPVTYQLTPAPVTMLAGANTVWADCGNTTLTYRANPYDRLLSRIEALEEDSLGKPSVNMGWMRPIANYFDTGSSSGLSVTWVDASDDAPVRPTPLSSTQSQPDTTDEPTEGDNA